MLSYSHPPLQIQTAKQGGWLMRHGTVWAHSSLPPARKERDMVSVTDHLTYRATTLVAFKHFKPCPNKAKLDKPCLNRTKLSVPDHPNPAWIRLSLTNLVQIGLSLAYHCSHPLNWDSKVGRRIDAYLLGTASRQRLKSSIICDSSERKIDNSSVPGVPCINSIQTFSKKYVSWYI